MIRRIAPISGPLAAASNEHPAFLDSPARPRSQAERIAAGPPGLERQASEAGIGVSDAQANSPEGSFLRAHHSAQIPSPTDGDHARLPFGGDGGQERPGSTSGSYRSTKCLALRPIWLICAEEEITSAQSLSRLTGSALANLTDCPGPILVIPPNESLALRRVCHGRSDSLSAVTVRNWIIGSHVLPRTRAAGGGVDERYIESRYCLIRSQTKFQTVRILS